MKHGQGSYIYVFVGKYVGGWLDNKKHGQGSFTFSDGFFLRGLWVNDHFIEERDF